MFVLGDMTRTKRVKNMSLFKNLRYDLDERAKVTSYFKL